MLSILGSPVTGNFPVRQIIARTGRAVAVFAGLLLALEMVLAPLVCEAEPSVHPATTRHMEYEIQRNGKRIGHCTFSISQTDAAIRVVRVSMEVRVKFLFVPVYEVRHERMDHWRGDELLALQGNSIRNGQASTLELTKESGNTRLTVNGEHGILTQPAYTFVPWLIEFPGEANLINEKGKPLRVTREDLGLETVELADGPCKLSHHVYRDPWPRDGWYDAQGRLLLLAYEKQGAVIRILLKSDRVEKASAALVAGNPQTLELEP